MVKSAFIRRLEIIRVFERIIVLLIVSIVMLRNSISYNIAITMNFSRSAYVTFHIMIICLHSN